MGEPDFGYKPGKGGDYGTFAPRCPSAPDFRPLKITDHVVMLAGMNDGAAHATAEGWGHTGKLFETTSTNMKAYGQALQKEWRSQAAEPFMSHVGGTVYSLDAWAVAARDNERALHRIGDAIQTAQTQMATLYASFQKEVGSIDENGALWADNPFGTDPGPEAMTKLVNEKTDESRAIMQTLADVLTGSPTATEGKFAGPADARRPTEAEMRKAFGGGGLGGGAPGAPGGAGAAPGAPGSRPQAPGGRAQAVLIPGSATYQGPPPAAPGAPPTSPGQTRGPAPAAPVAPPAYAPGGPVGPPPAPPIAPPGAGGATTGGATGQVGPPPAAPVIGAAGAAASAGLAGTRGAPPAAPRAPSGGSSALRGPAPQAPNAPGGSPMSPRSALQGRNAPSAPSSMPPGSGARGGGARPQIPGRSGGPGSPGMGSPGQGMRSPGSPGMGQPGSRGAGARPGGPGGRGAPGSPALPGRQAPRAGGGKPGGGMAPPSSGAPRSLQGNRAKPESGQGRTGRSLNGRGPIRAGTPGSAGMQGLRGRAGPSRAARSETSQTTRAALRRGLDGRGISTGKTGPASSAANGPTGRSTNAAPAKRYEEKRAAPVSQIVGDEELFAVDPAAPAVIERKQEKVHAKRPGPALGRG